MRKRAGAAAEDVDERVVRFIASDGSVDRFGDVIEPAGWDLRNFRRNPILLWMHDHALGPIGNVAVSGPDAIAVKDGKLVATANFASENLSEPVQRLRLWEQVKAKLLRTFSISARPLEAPDAIRDAKNERVTGYRYPKVELLEISLVAVPANPNAIVHRTLARARRIRNSAGFRGRRVSRIPRGLLRRDAGTNSRHPNYQAASGVTQMLGDAHENVRTHRGAG